MNRKREAIFMGIGILAGFTLSGPAAQAATTITATFSNQPIYVDGQRVSMTAYSIGGNNYVRLRDIGKAVNFGVTYDATANSVYVDSTRSYQEEAITASDTLTEECVRATLAKLKERYPSRSTYPSPYISSSNGPYGVSKLIDLIEKPEWCGFAPSGEPFSKRAEDTLTPDLISIVDVHGDYQFIIFDAKYYNLQLEYNKVLRGHPGIESITKQYLYQLAYQPFVDAHQIGTVRNCFLMPTAASAIISKGSVSMSMLENLGLQSIQVRLLPADLMYRHYLENTKLDILKLNL